MKHLLKTIFLFAFAALFALPLGACSKSKEDFSDTYNAETDFPLDGMRFMGSPAVGVDGGCYFVTGHFLLYLPDGSDEAVCVCGKPNCEHYKSADMDKYLQCDAYIPGLAMVRSVNNTLYAMAYAQIPNKDGSYDGAVYKISADGSQREELFTIPLNGKMDIGAFAIHRGYVYYIGDWFEKDGKLTSALFRHSLTDKSAEPELLYEAKNQYSVSLQCYGKYVYFDTYTDGVFTDKHTVRYDLQKRDASKFIEDEKNIEYRFPQYWNGKFFISKSITHSATDVEYSFWITDLDGQNPQPFSAFEPGLGELTCDSKYLYLCNACKQNEASLPLVEVFDFEGNVVATLDAPFPATHISEDGYLSLSIAFLANANCNSKLQ